MVVAPENDKTLVSGSKTPLSVSVILTLASRAFET